jgi:hypothetical protein
MDCAQALAITAAAFVMAFTIDPEPAQRAEAFVEAALTRASFSHARGTPVAIDMAFPHCSEAPKAIRL